MMPGAILFDLDCSHSLHYDSVSSNMCQLIMLDHICIHDMNICIYLHILHHC